MECGMGFMGQGWHMTFLVTEVKVLSCVSVWMELRVGKETTLMGRGGVVFGLSPGKLLNQTEIKNAHLQ